MPEPPDRELRLPLAEEHVATVRRTEVDIEDDHGRIGQPGSGASNGGESRPPRH